MNAKTELINACQLAISELDLLLRSGYSSSYTGKIINTIQAAIDRAESKSA